MPEKTLAHRIDMCHLKTEVVQSTPGCRQPVSVKLAEKLVRQAGK